MTKNLTAVALGLVLLLACDRNIPADYFPLKAGQQRAMQVYTRMISGTDTTETTEVKVVEIVHGQKDVPGLGKCWVVESPRDSGQSSYSFFRKNEDGVIQLMPTSADKPPVEILRDAGVDITTPAPIHSLISAMNRDGGYDYMPANRRIETGGEGGGEPVNRKQKMRNWKLGKVNQKRTEGRGGGNTG